MTTFETFLPLFSGFYSTIWEFREDDFLYSEGLKYDDIEVDFKSYEKDVVLYICDFVLSNCPFIAKVEFEEIISPREYNFRNDSANVKITVNVEQLQEYMHKHAGNLNKYLKARYTSCSGFISSYPNNVFDWIEDTVNFTELDGHYLGALLDFYFENEGIDEETAYYIAELSAYEYITVKHKKLEDFEDYELEEAALKIVDEIELFGYIELLVKDAKIRADKMLNFRTWQEIVCEENPLEVLAAANAVKLHTETLEIITT
jgi:hypothetical protein